MICRDFVNGHHVSRPQRELCEMLGGKLNYPLGGKRIDIALPGQMVAIEYDSWYWHADRADEDAARDEELLAAGWKVLHVKSGKKTPAPRSLDLALYLLGGGVDTVDIVLDDWEKGPTRGGRR